MIPVCVGLEDLSSYRARAGEPTDELLIETFAATREAGRRTLGMRHYDVQLLAGIALVHGSIVENADR